MSNDNYDYQLELINNKLDNFERNLASIELSMANRHVELIQSINMQISLLNSLSQGINSMVSKVSDIELSNYNSEDSNKDIIDVQHQIHSDILELKNSIEGMKFYILNASNSRNY